MISYKTLIVEDEDRSANVLKSMINKYCPQLEVVGVANSVASAIEMIQTLQPKVVFMDIELPDGTSFKIIDTLQPNVNFFTIFVTAYEHYAIKAIKRSALDYLLKPIDVDELIAAVGKLLAKEGELGDSLQQNIILNQVLSDVATRDQFIMALPTFNGLIFVQDEEIVLCQSDSNYSTVYLTNNKDIIVSRTLNDLEEVLSPDLFYRVHHSYLVNLKHIRRYIKGKGGYLELSNGLNIEVSSRRKQGFLDKFAQI